MDQALYWHIELYSGEIIRVRPNVDNVREIQEMIAKQEGSITTPTRSIIVKDIRDFRLSDEMYTDKKLLEDGKRAFGEPTFTKDGAMVCRVVKRSVPRRKWESHYSKIPSYSLLSENDSFVTIAFTVAIHEIDYSRVQNLTEDEERQLSRRMVG